MNFRVILNNLGKVCVVLAALLMLPMLVAILYAESCWWAFLVVAGISVVLGLPLVLWCRPKNQVYFAKEGLVTVALTWITVSVIGALPFVISGEIPNYIDALFEIVSGFTTTGATILTGEQIESMAKGMLFWRSFAVWIGGMGVIVFVMAVAGGATERSMHILRAEMPGPTVDKLVPRARTTTKILYLIYMGMTFALMVLLVCGGMPLFDSVIHAFGTAGTGGFSVCADSIANYSPFCQWTITVFMILFGVNFNLYYLCVVRKFRSAITSQEFWIYIGILIVSAVGVTCNLFFVNPEPYLQNFGDAVRHAVFQVASFMTTTGYTSIPAYTNINSWPVLARSVLFILMFVGGCAGSTAGGLKVSRAVMLWGGIKKQVRKLIHPSQANVVKFEGKAVSDATLHSVSNYFGIYMLIIFGVFIVLGFDPNVELDIETNISAAVSCFNNIGPAFGEAASGYYVYSYFSKLVLTFAMLFGRLEIYPMLICLAPSTWLKK